jgi:hypothetical protein
MKRFKQWLTETRVDLLDRGRLLLDGQEIDFGTPNNSRLHGAIRENYASGQEAMSDFVKWLIRHEGIRESSARMNAAEVWNALCMTWDAKEGTSHPEALFESSDYSQSSLNALFGYLRRWARYTKDPLLTEVIEGIRNRGKEPRIIGQPRRMILEPYTLGEIDAVLEATEKLRGDPRWPWGWPVFRLIIVGGLKISDLQVLTREAVVSGLATGQVFLWTPNRGARAMPAQLVRDELEALLAWPWSWGGISDIICPRSVDAAYAINMAISRLSRYVFELAGVEHYPKSWLKMARWATALRYYDLTGCLVGATHLLGSRNTIQVEAKLRALKARQKERDQRVNKKRRKRSVRVVDQAEAGADGDQRQEAVEGGGAEG